MKYVENENNVKVVIMNMSGLLKTSYDSFQLQ